MSGSPLEVLESASRGEGRPPHGGPRKERRRVVRTGTSMPGVRARVPGRAAARASAASGRSRSATTTRRSARRSAARRSPPGRRRSGATPTCCPSTRARPSTSAPASRRWSAPTVAGELGLGEVWVKNDTVNPTGSFKDRVCRSRCRRRASSGSRPRRARRPATSPTASPPTPRTRGCAATCSSPPISSRPRSSRPRSTAQRRGHRRQLRRRQPALRGDRREYRWAFVNMNMRPYYAEGSKTLAYEIAEQLGWERRTTSSCRSRPARCSPRSARASRSCTKSASSMRRPRAGLGRAGRGLLAGGDRVRGGQRHHPPGEPEDDRQVAGDRQPGRRVLRARRRARDRRGTGGGDRRRDRRGHQAAGPDRGDLRRDGGRRDHRVAGAARPRRRRPAGRAGRRLHHRKRPEDARRGRPARRADGDHPPTLDAFNAAFGPSEIED